MIVFAVSYARHVLKSKFFTFSHNFPLIFIHKVRKIHHSVSRNFCVCRNQCGVECFGSFSFIHPDGSSFMNFSLANGKSAKQRCVCLHFYRRGLCVKSFTRFGGRKRLKDEIFATNLSQQEVLKSLEWKFLCDIADLLCQCRLVDGTRWCKGNLLFCFVSAPHIGHLYTAVITDAISRFQRLINPEREVFFCTGTVSPAC